MTKMPEQKEGTHTALPGRNMDWDLDLAIQSWLDPEAPILFGAGTKKAKWGSYRDISSAEEQEIPNLVSVVNPPQYTKSIDAALTLVPEGLHWACSPSFDEREHRLYRPYSGESEWPEWTGKHKHDAIALCIAAIRARITLKDPNQ